MKIEEEIKQMQDKVWDSLTKEYKDYVLTKYGAALVAVELKNCRDDMMWGMFRSRAIEDMFGKHNLTNDIEQKSSNVKTINIPDDSEMEVIKCLATRGKNHEFIDLFPLDQKDDIYRWKDTSWGMWCGLEGPSEIVVPGENFKSIQWENEPVEVDVYVVKHNNTK